MSSYPVIGIDLGTTNSVVAVYNDDKIEVLTIEGGSRLLPSVVAFTNLECLVGKPAVFQAVDNLENTIFCVKRIIGQSLDDPKFQRDIQRWPLIEENDEIKILVKYRGETKKYLPEQISSMILKKLKKVAEDFLNTTITKAVITVPAYFNNAQRNATIDAAQLAGLNVLQIVNEPTAAAICFGLTTDKSKKPRTVLVYDFGGGTFDVSILKIDDKVYDVLAVTGDTHLGGEDINDLLVDHFIEQFKCQGTDISDNPNLVYNLRTKCEELKQNLSFAKEFAIKLDGTPLTAFLTQARFEDINDTIFEKTIGFVEKALNNAKLEKKDIDHIIMVGGSSRIPRVQELLQAFFDGKTLNKGVNPDESIAYGAAALAGTLRNTCDLSERFRGLRVKDVIPLSVGVALENGKMDVLIKKDTGIPFKMTKFYTAHGEKTTTVKIAVYEGERFLCSNNFYLGEFELKGIANLADGGGTIKITFEIDANGILHVSATEPATNIQNSIQITKNGRLKENDRMKAIDEAEKMAHEDQLHEARVNARNEFEKVVREIKREAEKLARSEIIDQDEKNYVFNECKKMIDWIDESQSIPREEFEERKLAMERYWVEFKRSKHID